MENMSLEVKFDLSQLTPQQLKIIKANVAKNATDDELQWFLYQASALHLNPLTKEIWFIKYTGGDCIIMTSRDGFLKKASENPEFTGIQSMEVRAKDEFEMGYENGTIKLIKHKWHSTDRGAVVGAWAVVTFKDGSQDWNYVTFSEWESQRNPVWKSKPSAMIKKCAEASLLRRAAKMTGVYLPEEIERDKVTNSEAPIEGRAEAVAELTQKIADAKTMEEYTAACNEISKVSKGLLQEEIAELRTIAGTKKKELEIPTLMPPATLPEDKKQDLENLANALKKPKKKATKEGLIADDTELPFKKTSTNE
jgi:phage recombination protein Bet